MDSNSIASPAVPLLQASAEVNANSGAKDNRQIAVQVVELCHRYAARLAVDRLSLQVDAGEVFALLGPNGSGKTTLFKILATLLAPSSGTAAIFGADVVARSHEVRSLIGVMFQSPSLDKKLTVAENLRYHGYLYGLRGAALRRRIDETLEGVHLRDRAKELVEKLSGGLMRRVEVAKSLIHQPRLLLLDEPSVGLDPGARRQLRELLVELRESRGVTSVLTTHLMDEADACDRVAIMDHGRLVISGPPDELKHAIGGDVIHFTSASPGELAKGIREKFSVESAIWGMNVRVEHPNGFEFAGQVSQAFAGWVTRVAVGRPTLEDVFLKYTGHHLVEEENNHAAAN